MLLCIFMSAVFGISEQLEQGINNNINNPAAEQPQKGIHEHVQRANTIRHAPLKIADHPACLADVKALCSAKHSINNFAVLECLQSDEEGYKGIDPKCQHVVWEYKRNLTKDMRFDAAASEVCKNALVQFPDCAALEEGAGHRIACLIEHKDNLTGSGCKQFLTKMASIVFGDYRLIYKFMEQCDADITKLQCGRLETEDDSPHSQGKTIHCLSEKLQRLSADCKHEILRIAELQADDYHLDRPLYYACREDREHFCDKVTAGAGKIYKCLMKHKFEQEMSFECREKLMLRQKLMHDDYKVNKALLIACRNDVRSHHCLRGDVPKGRFAKMSHVLLCLEGVIREGEEVAPECVRELTDMRHSLLEDFKISPELVAACSEEISSKCKSHVQHRGGEVLHCLMDLAKGRGKEGELISPECKAKVEDLMVETDVAENFYVDPLLQKACQPVVDVACNHIEPGDGKIIECLMEKLDSDKMTDECEERLMEIQYFVSRDFKLDPRLYKSCHKEAVASCHAKKDWYDPESENVEDTPMIFSCLYHLMKNYATDKKLQLSRACAFQVRRIMHQRAISIHLEPRIEVPCMKDLATFCNDKAGEQGEEMQCLQDHLDELTPDCEEAVGNFTEDEDEDVSLDRILMKECAPMMKRFCEDILEKDEAEPGEMMQCLIEHKHHPDMNGKCAAGVVHHQLMTLKDYNFSYKFKKACKEDVHNLCSKSRKKSEVVQCLSESVRNDTLLDVEMRVSRDCRRQLRFELLQRSENIDLDPLLMSACSSDVRVHCNKLDGNHGNAVVTQCLKDHRSLLTPECHKMIFKREKLHAMDSKTDFLLMQFCKRMIKEHCEEEEAANMFNCLRRHRHDEHFDTKCNEVIVMRLRTRALDYRLNPQLQRACKADISKFCPSELAKGSNPTELEGQVIKCLKVKFVVKMLSPDCETHVRTLMVESVVDYRQDPALANQCRKEIKQHCLHDLASDSFGNPESDHGSVVECLRKLMGEGKLDNMKCMQEVMRVISEEKADIHVDVLLHRACMGDLNHYCSDVSQGEGRQMSCLLAAYDDKRKLSPDCFDKLRDRVTLWEYSVKIMPMAGLQDAAHQILSSPSKNYFITVIFLFVGCMFIGGLFCGRVTKRVGVMAKNK